MPARGSSPRVRGKPCSVLGFLQALRLIPACAGKTLAWMRRISRWTAHPRVCGENPVSVSPGVRPSGSSPRVRGKPVGKIEIQHLPRLIPACAGKTRRARPQNAPQPAHPRVCGENIETFANLTGLCGSSPRVRGKQLSRLFRITSAGLIPACAGKTVDAVSRLSRCAAHPRVCGENTERSGVLTLRSVRSWKTLSFPSSLKITHCRAFVQLSLSRIRL